ncbi:MAG: type II secretion system protein GspG, partial [Bacillota bacterium]
MAAIILPSAFGAVERSKIAAAEADYKSIKSAVLNFYADTGKWPMEDTSLTETEYLVTGIEDPSKNPTGWNGPYLDRWPEKNP